MSCGGDRRSLDRRWDRGEIDADRDRAVRLVCREAFMRTDPFLGAIEAGVVRAAEDALTVRRTGL